MTCAIDDNQCKLLVLGLNTADSQTSTQDLRSYFTSYGSIEWIQVLTNGSSAVIHFTQSSTVDRLVRQRTGLLGQQSLRLRRFRSDDTNWHLDSCTLYVKFNRLVPLTEASLQHCFRDYQPYIRRLDVIDGDRALISFCDYDHVDRILLEPANGWMIHGEVPTLERLMTRPIKRSRWDQRPTPSSGLPVLAERNPVVHQLITHIEYLAKQLRGESVHLKRKSEKRWIFVEQPAHCRKEIGTARSRGLCPEERKRSTQIQGEVAFDKER